MITVRSLLSFGNIIAMKVLRVHAIIGLVLTSVTLTQGEKANSAQPVLATHDTVQKRLADPNLRLLDVRTRAEYDQGDITGCSRWTPRLLRHWLRSIED